MHDERTPAQTAVLLAALTYSSNPPEAVPHYLSGWKVVWNGIETADGNYAFIATDAAAQQYALAIRGSLPPFDIFTDFYAFANWVLEDLNVLSQVSWSYATTNDPKISWGASIAFNNILGMQDAMDSGLSIYEYLLANAVYADKPVMITGHSLGGNMANVYASYFVSSITAAGYTANNTSLYTFAAPAAGNSDFSTDLDNKLLNAWHYENANDIIPKCPVFVPMLIDALLFDPAPSAAEITTSFEGVPLSLREAIIVLAGILYHCGYQQQQRNYTIFPHALTNQYEANTLEDWFYQAAYQHGISNYAAYLGKALESPLAAQNAME